VLCTHIGYRDLSEAHIGMKITDLFYERALEKRRYSAEETYNCKEPFQRYTYRDVATGLFLQTLLQYPYSTYRDITTGTADTGLFQRHYRDVATGLFSATGRIPQTCPERH